MFVKSALISVDIIGKAMVLVRLAAIRFLGIYTREQGKTTSLLRDMILHSEQENSKTVQL